MMSGVGATINQYSGLPTYVAATSTLGPIQGSAKIDHYVASGQILRASAFGVFNPYLSGFASAGLLIGSGFAWAAAIGSFFKSRKEALLSGFFSSFFFYASTGVVVYLILISMDYVAGKEVPMLAIIQHFLPGLSVIYSFIIILAIFSTISGRLHLIGERYGRGDRKLTLAIVTSITVFASVGGSFIPFSKISNVMFSIFGAVGIILSAVVLIRFFLPKGFQCNSRAE